MKSKKLIVIIAVVLGVSLLGYIATRDADHDEHETHDDHAETSYVHDEHEGHDEDEGHDEHDEPEVLDAHDEGQAIELTPEAIREIGLETAKASAGTVDIHIDLPGEITFNTNKLAHVVPTVPGIVREAVKNIGDAATAGEIIAWIESTEVGGAKLDYLSKLSEMSCCSIELTRVQEIHDNTLKLLETLKDTPSLETLLQTNDSAMGMNRSRLVSSYAEFIFAKETYLREKDLYEKKITSKEEFLKAQLAFKKTDAEYTATKDSIAFEIKRDLLEARRTQQIQELGVQAAERLLYLHGLTAKDVKGLSALAKNQSFQAGTKVEKEEECDDPNCKECAAAAAKAKDDVATDLWATNEKLAWYPIRSPFDGTIIEKHIVLGELVGTDSAVYIVADLSSVWVDLQVYPKDLKHVKKGQQVVISANSDIPDASGVISYVGAVVGVGSRTALARVVLDNSSGVFRPGLFITARTSVSKTKAKVVIPKNAIQSLEGRRCVFVKDAHGFEPVFIKIGMENETHAEVLSGLTAGQEYVTKGAFILKSKIITSTLDSHAGHGH